MEHDVVVRHYENISRAVFVTWWCDAIYDARYDGGVEHIYVAMNKVQLLWFFTRSTGTTGVYRDIRPRRY